MSNTTFCDKCKITLPKSKKTLFILYAEPEPFMRFHLNNFPLEFDLCKECTIKLQKWLNNKEAKK